MGMEEDTAELVIEEFATLDGEECVVVYDMGDWTKTLCYGPFVNDEEARTFIACGPHGLEEYEILARIMPLYPPHALSEARNCLLEIGT